MQAVLAKLWKFLTLKPQPEMEKKNWYAVYTRPKWEKKVAELLTRKKVENYCPLNKVIRQWKDRKKLIMEPLFRSYVFVKLSDNELWTVRSTDGILNMVYWLNKPAMIRENEITVIKQFLNDYENIQLEKTSVNLNDTVRITGGPLMYREGNVVEVMNKTVRVVLPSLGYQMIAEISKSQLEKVINMPARQEQQRFVAIS